MLAKKRDITTDTAASATPSCGLGIIYSHMNVSQTLRLRSKNAKNVEETEGQRILLVQGCCVALKKQTNIHIHTVHTNISVNL